VPKSSVLFLCTGNSARSQMAEGLLRHLGGGKYEVVSAGLDPKGVHPLAIEAMREIDIDISAQTSKHVTEFLGRPFTYVITVCDSAKERCPIFPSAYKFLHWSFPDPAAVEGDREQRLSVFRRVRDDIAGRILRELLPRNAPSPR
jgi:arsenate reductase